MNLGSVVGMIFVVVGVLCIVFQKQIYKRDTRMKRFIKSEDEYRVAIFLFGFVFCFLGLTVFVLSATGFMK